VVEGSAVGDGRKRKKKKRGMSLPPERVLRAQLKRSPAKSSDIWKGKPPEAVVLVSWPSFLVKVRQLLTDAIGRDDMPEAHMFLDLLRAARSGTAFRVVAE